MLSPKRKQKIQSYFKGFYLPKGSGAFPLRPLYPYNGVYAEQPHHAHDLPLRFPLAFGAGIGDRHFENRLRYASPAHKAEVVHPERSVYRSNPFEHARF